MRSFRSFSPFLVLLVACTAGAAACSKTVGGRNDEPTEPIDGSGGGASVNAGGEGGRTAGDPGDSPAGGGTTGTGGVSGVELSVSRVAPSVAYFPGGRSVTIEGDGFDSQTSVTIGGEPCASFQDSSETEIECVVPSHDPGDVDVVVARGNEEGVLSDGFTYRSFSRIDTIAGTGTAGDTSGAGDVAQFSEAINDIQLHGDRLLVADGINRKIRTVDLSNLDMTDVQASDVVVGTLSGTGVKGDDDSSDASATFSQPDTLLVDDDVVYVLDTNWTEGWPSSLRTVDLVTGATTTLRDVSDDLEEQTGLSGMIRLNESTLLTADCWNFNNVQQVDLETDAAFSDYAGMSGVFTQSDDGAANTATFECPYGLAWGPDRTAIYVTNYLGHSIRVVNPLTRAVSTIAGAGTAGENDSSDGNSATFNGPFRMSGFGDYLFVSQASACTIRQLQLSTTAVGTVAGVSGECTAEDGALGSARLNRSAAILYSPEHGIFFGASNFELDEITLDGTIRLIH